MHFLVELIAAGFLVDGQICPRPSPHDARRLVEDGQFVRARQVIPGLVEDAKRTGSAPGWQAKLWQAEAVALFERSKTVFERVYGSGHPDTIAATYAPGAALTKSTPARAEVMVRQAVANWRASQPERHSNMVKFLAALASSRWAQGDASEAGVLGEQALRLSRELFGPEHPHAIAQMCEHARLLKAIGEARKPRL